MVEESYLIAKSIEAEGDDAVPSQIALKICLRVMVVHIESPHGELAEFQPENALHETLLSLPLAKCHDKHVDGEDQPD